MEASLTWRRSWRSLPIPMTTFGHLAAAAKGLSASVAAIVVVVSSAWEAPERV